MANTYTSLYYHLVYSTKNRIPWLQPAIENRVWEMIGGIARQHQILPIRIGGYDDHLHLLMGIPPTLAVSKAMQYLKGGSSKMIHELIPEFREFAWQDGYSVFTVSKSIVPSVIKYIEHQREHHVKMSFQDELRALLEKHSIDCDERYLWG